MCGASGVTLRMHLEDAGVKSLRLIGYYKAFSLESDTFSLDIDTYARGTCHARASESSENCLTQEKSTNSFLTGYNLTRKVIRSLHLIFRRTEFCNICWDFSSYCWKKPGFHICQMEVAVMMTF